MNYKKATKDLLKIYGKLLQEIESFNKNLNISELDAVLLELFSYREFLHLGDVIFSKRKTEVLLSYVTEYLTQYERLHPKRAVLVKDYYIAGKSLAEISRAKRIDSRTLKTAIDNAIEDLSVIFFGIDALETEEEKPISEEELLNKMIKEVLVLLDSIDSKGTMNA